jgi:moderate conductance mechanosensitive channel
MHPLLLLCLRLICGAFPWVAAASAIAAPLAAVDGATTAATAPTPTGAPAAAGSPVEIQQLIDALKDPERRAVLIATLENLQKAVSNTAPAVATPGSAIPTPKPAGVFKPDNLGTQLVALGARLTDTVWTSLLLVVRGIADIPDLLRWLRRVIRDPATLLSGLASTGRLLCVGLLALGGEFLVKRVTHRFYASLASDAYREDSEARAKEGADTEAGPTRPNSESTAKAHRAHRLRLRDRWLLLRRMPFVLMALTVDLLPPLAFLTFATLLSGTPLVEATADRAVILAVVKAYVIVRVAISIIRATVGTPSAHLRLLTISDDAARYLMLWVRRAAVTIVLGYAASQFGLLFGMDSETQQSLLRLTSLLVHVMLVVMVLQSRATVAARLRGSGQGLVGALRHRLANVWHVYAIIFIAGTWIVYAAEIRDGFERLIYFMLSTLVVGLTARVADILLVGALDRTLSAAQNGSSRSARIEERLARYHQPLQILLRLLIIVVAVATLLQVWGLDALGWFARSAIGNRLASSVVTLILTLGIAVILWEATNVALQVYLDGLAQQGAAIRAARLRTIVPLLRNTLLITLMVLTALTVLSEVGVNIGPLLAGASIFGVALGFGSQKLVQDFITGIFLLVENAMHVGDTVTVGGLAGVVEDVSIRTIRLRAADGSLHLIPFSSVSTVTNSNRGIGNAAVAVTVDCDEDSDRVGAVLTKIVQEMRRDRAFANGMLSDLQLWGVDRVDGVTMTLVGQIVCSDWARWEVQREFNRRVKIALRKEDIRMMPTVSVTDFRHPLDVKLERPAAMQQALDARRPPVQTHDEIG